MLKRTDGFSFILIALLACLQLMTGCLTTESGVRSEAQVSQFTSLPDASGFASNRPSAGMTAEEWRVMWESTRMRRDFALSSSDYRDIEAGLFLPNEIHGGSLLSSLRSSSRGGSSYRAPSDSWGSSNSVRSRGSSLMPSSLAPSSTSVRSSSRSSAVSQ